MDWTVLADAFVASTRLVCVGFLGFGAVLAIGESGALEQERHNERGDESCDTGLNRRIREQVIHHSLGIVSRKDGRSDNLAKCRARFE